MNIRQVTVSVNSLHHQMNKLSDEFVQLKGEIVRKKQKVFIVTL